MKTAETTDTFKDILDIAGVELKPICTALRKLIATLDPRFHEVVWPKLKIASFGVGPKKLTQHYAYIAVQGSHVNLGIYHGASLPDPAQLLEGTGKALRHVKVRELGTVKNKAIKALLVAAIAERRPFAKEVP
jgi:hypothetical protein